MENNRQNCYEIAKRIYKLDKDVYECLGSSLVVHLPEMRQAV